MAFDVNKIVRQHIKLMKPYSSARDEYTGSQGVFLDANENAFGSPGMNSLQEGFHRYPDPHQVQLKYQIARIKGVMPQQIFLGNGSDEAIDLLIRAFCVPGQDNIVINPPTYGMYQVAAETNDVGVKEALLTADFDLSKDHLQQAIDQNTKIIFICSPNNPTGNLMSEDLVMDTLRNFDGLVVVDEAYIDFAAAKGYLPLLQQYPNLVVLQTFSKAWGMASLRLGMAFASPDILAIINKIKPPYNINGLTQRQASNILKQQEDMQQMVQHLLEQREKLEQQLIQLPFVEKVYPSSANFLLVKVEDPVGLFHYLIDEKIIVRDRSRVILCDGCLRITVGTENENQALMEKLLKWKVAID